METARGQGYVSSVSIRRWGPDGACAQTCNRPAAKPYGSSVGAVPTARRAARGGAARARRALRVRALPAVVREGLVGLCHAEDVVLPLVRAALLGLRVEELVGEALGHRLLAPVACELDEPADREGAGA